MSMRMVAAVSDLHGNLPPMPACDVLIVAGDVSPLFCEDDRGLMLQWLDTNFRKWLTDAREAGVKHIIGIGGNHDWIFVSDPEAVAELALPWAYLLDSSVEIDGVKYYGLPWVANLRGWAFYQDGRGLTEKYGRIPYDTDVIISHSPPIGYGDGGHPEWTYGAVNDAIKRVRPRAFVCGHIHEGYGIYPHRKVPTTIYNVSFVDERYAPQYRITRVAV